MRKKVILVGLLFIVILSLFEINALAVDITAEAATLIDFSSGKEIYGKNSNQKMYPASLTKILTALIVAENCDVNEMATVSQNAINSVESGYVTANLKVGEQINIESLLNILLIASSNDVANVLAEHVAGSKANFIELMNSKAKELGCTNTNFTNVNGTHDENHYSSAHDIALISRYCIQNEIIRQIVNKTHYELDVTNVYTAGKRVYSTTNELIMSGSLNYYKYGTGIKTGFTTPARSMFSIIC